MKRNIVLIAGFCGLRLLAQTPCHTVVGDQITGAELAQADMTFRGIPGGAVLAPAPLFGSTRLFSVAELRGVASRFGITAVPTTEACFRVASDEFNLDKANSVMQKSLGIAAARIEIVEASTNTIPAGSLEFPLEGLGTPGSQDRSTPVVWRGNVQYGANRRFSLWAKVRIYAPVTRLIAAEGLKQGVPIQPEQLRYETQEAFPIHREPTLSMEQIAGMVTVRAVPAGAELTPALLTRPNDVNRGDAVRVQVQIGAAHLAFTGHAESAGHLGETVSVRNPDSNRIFRARVDGRGSVIVDEVASRDK